MAETKQRNIYEKMSAVKTKMIGIKKSGANDYSKYKYFELGDILPVLTPALQEERLFMKTEFSATEQIAKLIVIDIDEPESQIDFETKFAECNLRGAHEIQNLGAAQTYTRRYLIITAFDIVEADVVDAGAEEDDKKPEQKQHKTWKGKQSVPTKPETQQINIEKLKRDTWELIKQLPAEQQAKYLNLCKEATAEDLQKIIGEIAQILNGNQEQKEESEEHKKRVDELKKTILDLIERLPAGIQKGWFVACQNTNSIVGLNDLHKLLLKSPVATSTTGTSAQTTPNNPPKEKLEIF